MFDLSARQTELLERAELVGADLADPTETPGHGVNRPVVESLSASGLLPLLFGESSQISAMDLCLMRQGLARTNPDAETAFAMQGLGAYPIVQSGTDAQRSQWVPGVAAGELIPAFALSEPDAGSDAAALSLAASPDGGGWRLSGEKAWISNAPDADFYVVFGRTGTAGARGISAFVVAGDAEGLSGESVDLLSPHPIGHLTFDGVLVESDRVIGAVGEGFKVAMTTLDLFRPSVGAFAVGMAEAALRSATSWAQSREAFGRPLSGHQALAHRLADLATDLEAAALLVYRAASTYDDGEGELVRRRSAMAKLFATETAQRVVDAAVQVQGARGLVAGSALERLYREVRAPRIYEGTSEIQREIIARELWN